MPDTVSRSRSKLASATYTAIALVFFFSVGLAGGAAYKVYFGDDGGQQVAEEASPAPPASPLAPPQDFAANAPNAADKAAPDLAPIEPSAPPALAPTVPKQPEPAPALAQAPTPSTPETAPQAAPTEPSAVPAAEIAPAKADAQAETQAAKPPRIAAIPPKKLTTEAKTHRAAPPQHMGPRTAGPYRVQFGAFAHEDNARRVQSAIEATGLKVEISHEPGPGGHSLFFVRSPSYPDYASALSAAQTVQARARHFVNAIAIDYAIRSDHPAPEQQAQMH